MAEPQEFKLIDIRKVWPGEATDFTPWLADNLPALAEHLGIHELELDGIEVEVPGCRRKIDILARDPDDGKWAIENQYGEADHDHLTRALAYAVGLECRAVILVAESYREEFTALADEWNRYSEMYGPEGIRLFLAAIEAGRVGDSAPGFRFRLVAGPNEWKSETAAGPRRLSEAGLARREARHAFWSGLQKVMSEREDLSFNVGEKTDSSWLGILGRGPFSLCFGVKMKSSRVELRIGGSDREENDRLHDALIERRDAISSQLDAHLEWIKNPTYRVNRIYWEPDRACGYRSPLEEHEAGYQVLAHAMYRFRDVFMPHIEELLADS